MKLQIMKLYAVEKIGNIRLHEFMVVTVLYRMKESNRHLLITFIILIAPSFRTGRYLLAVKHLSGW